MPEAHNEGFTAYLYETGVKDSSATPGFLGAQIFRRSLTGKIELTLITYWDKLESIHTFAGHDISQARLYPEDEVYELEPDLSVQHYEVIEHRFSPELRGINRCSCFVTSQSSSFRPPPDVPVGPPLISALRL
ncbi:MAG: antibiotic biosynthesis monooxygenase [Marinobacter sp.]|nr:antibiotic biosynthesis monooxygenase [Marinobacter sp.]